MHEAIQKMPGMPDVVVDYDSPREALKRWAVVIIENHNGDMLKSGLRAVRACADYLNRYDKPAQEGE